MGYKGSLDGSYKINSGLCAIGYHIKKEDGDFIYATTRRIEKRLVREAEVIAMRFGLEYYIEHNLQLLVMETYSHVLKNILNGI